MSDDTSKADTIAFHFYTKLFYTVNHARATEEARAQSRVDKWFNLETPDSDLFTREAREPYRSISQAPPPGPLPMEIQVLLSVPELTNNQALVYISPDSTRVRIEPTPRFILLETWTLEMNLHQLGRRGLDANTDISPPVIYKHGIILFRSLFSLLRVLPSWKFYKRLKRKVGGVNRNGHLGIQLRVRPAGAGVVTDRSILGFDERLSPTQRTSLPTSTHTFPPVPHLLGSFTLHTTYLSTPNFQLDELESLLSSRFISLDLEGFVPTLDKNKQRDSLSGSSSLPNSSGVRSMLSRSPPKAIGMGRTTSAGAGAGSAAADNPNPTVADRFILPTRVASIGGAPSLGISASTGTTALIPPPRPFPFPSTNPNPSAVSLAAAQPIPASGLAIHRLRRESLNSSGSSSISARDRDRDNPYPVNPANTTPFSATAAGGTSSLSSSPISGALPIRRPHLNPVHPFKSNTISSASGSSPSLSIRQGVTGLGGSPSAGGVGVGGGVGGPYGPGLHSHSRQPSSSSPVLNPTRVPPSPIGTGFSGVHPSPPGHVASFTPSSLGDRGERRPGMSGSGASEGRASGNGVAFGVVGGVGGAAGTAAGGGTGGESDDSRGASAPMAMPRRKRYSSSFGHRYVGSLGSTGGGGLGGAGGKRSSSASASASGMSGEGDRVSVGAEGGKVVEGGSPGSRDESGVAGARKEGIPSLLGIPTDDDDISIFVQHIDERKPLRSHDKEREREEWDRGRGRDRERTDDSASTKKREKGKQRAQEAEDVEDVEEDNGRFQGLGHHAPPYTTSPPPLIDAAVPGGTSTSTSNNDEHRNSAAAAAAAAAAYMSTSPNRGPMLTNRDEVDERLKMMNENFLKSLEGIGGSRSRRSKRMVSTTTTMRSGKDDASASAGTSTSHSDSNSKERSRSESAASSSSAVSNANNSNNNTTNAPTSRFSPLGFPASSSSSRGGGGAQRDASPSYAYNTPSLGLGLGRGRQRRTSVSSSMLGDGEGGMGPVTGSQGSEEVIGRMELYEERRRGGFGG